MSYTFDSIENGTTKMVVGTDGLIWIAKCENNFVTSEQVCPVAAWSDTQTLAEIANIAFRKNLLKK